jgi:hypothetical protein
MPDHVVAPLLRALICIPRTPDNRLLLKPADEGRRQIGTRQATLTCSFAVAGSGAFGASITLTSPTARALAISGIGIGEALKGATMPKATRRHLKRQWLIPGERGTGKRKARWPSAKKKPRRRARAVLLRRSCYIGHR